MAWAVNKYGYINAKLRAQLSKRITGEEFSRMVEASDLTEALQVLKNTEYEEIFAVYHETGDIKMVERDLVRREIDDLKKLRTYLDTDVIGIIDGFLERYEVEALKDALRYWFDRVVRGRSVDEHTIYMQRERILNNIDFSSLVYAADVEAVLKELSGTPYERVVAEYLPKALDDKRLFELECALENCYYKRLMDAIDNLNGKDGKIAKSIIGIQIDMENIGRLSRAVRFFKDLSSCGANLFLYGGKNINIEELKKASEAKSPKDFVKETVGNFYGTKGLLEGKQTVKDDSFFVMLLSVLQDIFIDEVMKLKPGYPFTIGIVLAYCFIKQREIKKIIGVLNAHYYNVGESRMREIV